MHQALISKLEDRSTIIGIIGQGYVGLSVGLAAARAGFEVVGVDLSADLIAGLQAGRQVVPGVRQDEFDAGIATGRMTFSTSAQAVADADVVLICVPTPVNEHRPDLTAVEFAGDAVGDHLKPGALVILESTTYPGTTDQVLAPRLEKGGMKAGQDFMLAYSPERIDTGNEQFGFHDVPRVVGGMDEGSTRAAATFYGLLVDTVHPVSSTRAAEMAKLLENTYRMVNIAQVKELAMVCHDQGLSPTTAPSAPARRTDAGDRTRHMQPQKIERDGPSAAVIVPAHNEEVLIGRCLTTMLRGAEEGEFELIVASNASTDRTVENVRRIAPDATVLDLPTAGKFTALASADEVATVHPRLYVDADVVVDCAALRAVVKALSDPGVEAAAPLRRVDTRDRPWLVRSYFRCWNSLPALGTNWVGSGFYGLSAQGHAAVAPFPPDMVDDLFVNVRIPDGRKRVIAEHTFTVEAPKTLAATFRRAVRLRRDNVVIDRSGETSRRRTTIPDLLQILTWRRLPDVAVFLTVQAAARVVAKIKPTGGWNTDLTKR